MRTLYPEVGLKRICGLFGITRQAYYDYHKRCVAKLLVHTQVIEMVKAIRKVHPRMGGRKLYELLKPELNLYGIKLGRDKLFDLLSINQLLIKNRKRRITTTNSYHHFRTYKNLIKGFEPYQANQLWVSDITYIRLDERFYYLFLITDAYSRRIMGYKIARSLETVHATDCVQMALNYTQDTEGLIHHSDRGIQYCSREYVKLLQDNNIQISMTQDGNPLDNPIAERVNGILKEEYLLDMKARNYEELQANITLVIHKYNQLRPHSSCEMMTPNEAYKRTGILKRKWKNYFKQKEEIIY